jgi:uncharacterized membrane-anchored protein
MNKRIFYGAVLLQVLFLVGMIMFNYSVIWWGKEIQLEIVPIDPHSLFSGEYVALNYKISDLELGKLEFVAPSDSADLNEYFTRNSRVYVQLRQNGESWQATRVSKNRDDMGDSLFISGRVLYYESLIYNEYGKQVSDPHLRVTYGIESYYTEEGESMRYQNLGADRVRVRVAVDQFGRAQVVGLKVLPKAAVEE